MSVTVICQGCGQAFETGEGYTRNKIQCPSCGVICPVPQGTSRAPAPASTGRKAPARSRSIEDEAAEILRGDDPSPLPAPSRSASPFDTDPDRPDMPPAPVVRKPPAKETWFKCRRCGGKVRRQGECPTCDAAEPAPGEGEERPAVPNLSLDDPVPFKEEEDASPYQTADKDLPVCPECRKTLPEGGVVCPRCGFDSRSKKKAARSYEPIARAWDTTMALEKRLAIYVAWLGVTFVLGVTGTLGTGSELWPFITSWITSAGVLAFLIGTFERVQITRDRRGRVTFTSTWRYCFLPIAPKVTEVRGFSGVSRGQGHDAGMFEWLVFFWLLVGGVIGAIVWWYFVIHKLSYHAALTRDHGYPELYCYRGRNEEQMREVFDTLRTATGLPEA